MGEKYIPEASLADNRYTFSPSTDYGRRNNNEKDFIHSDDDSHEPAAVR